MADKRDDRLDLFQYSEKGYDYWNQWYSYPPYGYYPYDVSRMSRGSQSLSQAAQSGSQSAISNPEDHDISETDSEDENSDTAPLSQKVGKFGGHSYLGDQEPHGTYTVCIN